MFRKKRVYLMVLLPLLLTSGCMRYLTQDRSKVLLDGVDIDQTLKIAEYELEKGGLGSVLTVWAIRDQKLTKEQGAEVSRMYFKYIDNLERGFSIWHLTWAIADIYRLGDESVKNVMQKAYNDATVRAKQVSHLADKMANGDKMYLGDAHGGGRRYAHKHVVVPGNKRYIQSWEEFKEKKNIEN